MLDAASRPQDATLQHETAPREDDRTSHADELAPEREAGARSLAGSALSRGAWQAFEALVASVRDHAIFMLDPDGRVATWNAGAESITGWKAHEIVGEHISVLYTPEDVALDKPGAFLRRAIEKGRIEEEGWSVDKHRRRFWASVLVTLLQDEAGATRGFTVVMRDVTERHEMDERLRRSEERFRLLLESVVDYGIFMLSPQGRVLTWNAGAARINGYEREEIVGQHISKFYTEQDRRAGKCEHELEMAERQGRFEDEGWRVRKDGSKFWASVITTALRGRRGELQGFTKVTRDMTARREAEDERVRLAQAEEAIRLRDEFLSIASHELKTPLTVLLLQLQSLRDRTQEMDSTMARRLQRASESSDRLVGLVDALLDVSRIATGRFTLRHHRFDLVDAVRRMIEHMSPSAERAGCELLLESPDAAVGDWDLVRLEQVMTNLLANAIKYGAGRPVRVAVRLIGEEEVSIEVADAGPGIPAGDLERIFGRFERAASIRHYGGLGLGLYVTREIVEAHGGSILARNLPEGGASFVVRLPLHPPGRAQPSDARALH